MIQISDILAFLQNEGIPFSFFGDDSTPLDRFSSLSKYKSGSFTWIKTQKNIPDGFDLSQLALVFTAEDVNIGNAPNVIRTPRSKQAFFSTIEHFYAKQEDRPAIGQFTYISPKVKLGENVRIGHNCTLDGEITVGDNTVIWNNVVLVNRVSIGENSVIHSGAVIGHDGLGYTVDENNNKPMIKHFGGVTIGDDVVIFENVCIARGTIDDTVVESGSRIDSLCHIAHNCRVEEKVTLAAPCRLNGSVTMGKNSYIAGGMVRNQCSVGESAFVGLGAVVVNDVPPGVTVAGVPAKPLIKK